jgi:hypothetical protein
MGYNTSRVDDNDNVSTRCDIVTDLGRDLRLLNNGL